MQLHRAIYRLLGLVIAAASVGSAPYPAYAQAPTPHWIWLGKEARPDQTVFFRKEIQTPPAVSTVRLYAAADNAMTVWIDGRQVLQSDHWENPSFLDVSRMFMRQGRLRPPASKHVIAVRAHNSEGPGGLLVKLVMETSANNKPTEVVSDASWLVSDKEQAGWNEPDFKPDSWAHAVALAPLGSAPWNVVNEASLERAARLREPTATDPKQMKIAKGFKVELLYTVPQKTQGSWVNMTVDPKGRLIVSDQYGQLYRVTPPALGADASTIKIEPIEVAIGEAQGLCWAFDSLYVVVNRGQKYPSGLYRVRDTNGDDKLDTVEPLRMLNGGGEHGPHAVIPGPDGKSLYIVAGNATKLTDLASSLVPKLWDEDQILPYMPDGRGFMRDERAPGGCIYRIDPDGKDWTLVSMGYRNPYDIAFNQNGDLFTYDSDMEWDMNTPWYRPTRVCHVASGSDFGYRNGSGKWPPYYPDSLPPVVEIGPGSPTGVAFGYGAKFPVRYQRALFICDWSYGKLYAVHLKPDGSSYKADIEEFIAGAPLPLTDLVVNPTDGAMYFAIGGRRVLSGLYRVTATESEAAVASQEDSGQSLRAIRRKLEALHTEKDPKAIDTAWPYLGHADRFVRYAARVAIEHQDPRQWQERALAEKDPQASLTALLALARTRAKDLQGRLLENLERLDWSSLSHAQKLDLLRVYELAFIRMGAPDSATAARVTGRFDPLFPAGDRALNSELCKLLVYLQDPSVAAKAIALMQQAPTQEEQMDYATSLRMLKSGWSMPLRKAYFSWFQKASQFRGGASFTGFLREIQEGAIATLSPEEKAELKPLLTPPAEPRTPVATAPPRPFVKEWTLDALAPIVESGLSQRNFERGRSLFGAASCSACHRFANEGGAMGPDLTGVSGRFSPRDLLESILVPSKTISDQYEAVNIATADGRVITGRIVNLHGDTFSINTNMLDPNALVNLDRKQIEQMERSPDSMMPQGLLNTLSKDEVLDLMAYLLSGGDKNNKVFQRPSS